MSGFRIPCPTCRGTGNEQPVTDDQCLDCNDGAALCRFCGSRAYAEVATTWIRDVPACRGCRGEYDYRAAEEALADSENDDVY